MLYTTPYREPLTIIIYHTESYQIPLVTLSKKIISTLFSRTLGTIIHVISTLMLNFQIIQKTIMLRLRERNNMNTTPHSH